LFPRRPESIRIAECQENDSQALAYRPCAPST
jgi:hypothetical protein